MSLDENRATREDSADGGPRAGRAVGVVALSLLLVMMALVSVVISVTRVSDFAGTSKALSLGESLSWDLTSTAAWAVLLPAMVWLARRVRLPHPRPWIPIAIQVAATVPMSIAHVVLMGMARWALYSALGGRYDPWWPLRNGFYEYRKDVLTYGALLVFLWSWQALWRGPPAPQPIAGAPDAPLEVRDGGRRHFVRPQDIAWVEAAGNYVALHLDDREVLMRAPLASLEARLTTAGFARIHRSRLVNRARIASVEGTPAGDFTVTLRDGRTLTGSRRYRQAL